MRRELKDRYDQLKTERDALWAENEAMRDTLFKIHSLSTPMPHLNSPAGINNSDVRASYIYQVISAWMIDTNH